MPFLIKVSEETEKRQPGPGWRFSISGTLGVISVILVCTALLLLLKPPGQKGEAGNGSRKKSPHAAFQAQPSSARPDSGSGSPPHEKISAGLEKKTARLNARLRESEKKRSHLLSKFDNGTVSIINFKIDRMPPDEAEMAASEVTSLYNEILNSEIPAEDKTGLASRLLELNDYIHWTTNKNTNKEYQERAVSVHVDPDPAEGDALTGYLTEATGPITSGNGGIRAQGSMSKKLLVEKQVKKRFGHLFEVQLTGQ